MNSVSKIPQPCIGIGLVFLALWIFWPGLYGNFYLDDFPNLSPLENAGINETPLFSYLLNPAVSGLGRPLSYLSFLLQKDAWPNDPFAFKVVNLGIHFFNAAFVFIVALLSLRLYSRNDSPASSERVIALSCALIWVILPIHTSAIFYVVQRMTLLSALFSLCGIAGYLWVRQKYEVWNFRQYLLAGSFVCFGYLGILAKENAIQTGLLIWALELTVLSKLTWRPAKFFQWTVLLSPFCVLIVYLFTLNDVLSGYSHRDFTLKERLLTQAVVFWEYVSKVVLPTPSRLHLFNDGGEVYSEIFSNLKVLFSLLALLIVTVGAVFWRKTYPWLAFAVLFFCLGHVLESTFIPLEMNFEHRNYLPAVGLVIGGVMSLAVNAGFFETNATKKKSILLLLAVWMMFISSVSMLEARTWGSSKSFALSSLVDRPESYRARQEAAAFFLGNGEYLTAANLLYSIDSDFKVYAGTYAQLLLLKCYDDSIPLPPESKIRDIFENAPVDMGAEVAFHDLWRIKRSNTEACSHVNWEQLSRYLEALISNHNFSNSLNLKLLSSFISADLGNYGEAISVLENLPPSQKDTAVHILIVRFYIMDENLSEALLKINQVLDSASELDKLVYETYLKKLREDVLKSKNL